MQGKQVAFVELECCGKLLGQLPDRVDELREHRRRFFLIDSSDKTAAIREFVPECEPFLFQQRLWNERKTRNEIRRDTMQLQSLICKKVLIGFG